MAAPTGDELDRVHGLVRAHLGFDTLREGQAETIARALRGESVLAIMPTGGGKSICYQLPGVLSKGVTLVVSPLLALMKDQLDGMPPAMRAASASLTSEMPAASQRRLLDEVARGRYRMLYVAPERLRQPALLRALHEAGVARLVVDEAHCVSTWGHDFRPEYLAIAEARRAMGEPPLLALTATASPRVERDILERLGEMVVVRASVHRPNLRLEAVLAKDVDEKLGHLLQLCRRTKGPGVVYAGSRAKCEQLAAALAGKGANAAAFHAGLRDRALRQDAFMRGDIEILVATVAFGMGVDKQDLRFVFHHDPPPSLENYYQEAGRAGRDGKPARCVVLATRQDQTTLRSRAKGDLPSPSLIDDVWKLLLETLHEDRTVLVDPVVLDRLDEEPKPRVALSMLEEAGAIERIAPRPEHEGLLAYRVLGDTSKVERVLEAYVARAHERSDEMFAYLRDPGCRHAHLRRFFGEDAPDRCGNCDRCLGIRHEPMATGAEDDEGAARAILDALAGIRGIGEVNLVHFLRGDARAADWLQARPGYGALAFRSESKVKALVRDLEARGLLVRETLDHGGSALRLADPSGNAGTEGPSGPSGPSGRPARGTPQTPQAPRAEAAPDPLFEALRAWRREAADAEGVPPFVVAHDTTLRAIADARPATLDALRAVKGMGPKKVEKYGEAILAVVAGKA